MKKPLNHNHDATPQVTPLRQLAEEMARKSESAMPEILAAQPPEVTQRMLHELRVHQIELEMQNEELQRTQVELLGLWERYFDLYDLAPVGYFTINEGGLVMEANLTAVTMLGIERKAMIGKLITGLIIQEDQDIYYKHRKALLATGEDQACELRMRHPHKPPLWVRLAAVAAKDENGRPTCRVVISDISERWRNRMILEARTRLMVFGQTHSMDELLRATLDEAELLTGSQVGFYHFLEDDQQTLALQVWSTNTEQNMCKAEGGGRHYPVADAGVWVDCIREGRAVIHNNYAALPHRKGLPPGHATVVREMVVPVQRHGRIVAILGMGNKETDYTDEDTAAITTLADLGWDIAESKRAEDALKNSLHEKESLLKEIHHRVRNNLQIITSLLRLQADKMDNVIAKDAMQDMQNRVRSMALIHEHIYRSENLAAVDMATYLKSLCQQLVRTLHQAPEPIKLNLELTSVSLGIDKAIPCGLLVNELVTNAIKHAFPETRGGQLRVELNPLTSGLGWHLRVADNGVGLPSDFDLQHLTSLGLQLVNDLTRQLGGQLEIGAGPGAVFDMTFPNGEA